jgi:glycosyltransferase involved in cell wall biosynthesis
VSAGSLDATARAATQPGVDVLHVTQVMLGGVRRYLTDLVAGLDELGVRQALVYSPTRVDVGAPAALAAMRARGVAVTPIAITRAITPWRDALSVARLGRLIGALRPRVVHLHSSKAGALGRLALATSRVRPAVVYTPHASAANLAPRYATIERMLARLGTDRVVAVSPSEHAELARLAFVPASRLTRVDTGIARDEICRAAAAAESPVRAEGRPLVVAAGRLCDQKDPLMLVRASRRLAVAHPGLHFVWAGDGELRAAVERDVAAAGLGDRWTLLDTLANPYPLLAAAAVVALPSRYEGLPLVLLEAMALGRPMVATDVTGSRDLVVPGETGELAPPGDDAAFAAAIARVVGEPARAARYGAEGARRAATHYTRDRMAAEMRAVYAAVAPV